MTDISAVISELKAMKEAILREMDAKFEALTMKIDENGLGIEALKLRQETFEKVVQNIPPTVATRKADKADETESSGVAKTTAKKPKKEASDAPVVKQQPKDKVFKRMASEDPEIMARFIAMDKSYAEKMNSYVVPVKSKNPAEDKATKLYTLIRTSSNDKSNTAPMKALEEMVKEQKAGVEKPAQLEEEENSEPEAN